ncbi:MAG: hypothetical protein UU95_C0017G0023 [Parcubacteria group bacterium GW2011_GWC2_42_12]|nr:MAG: hypothetical protein UU95_C0017G0023 [Parcubacteria group bacterium GW2011_GWC2_42_12]
MKRLFHGGLLIKSIKLIFILAVFLLSANGSLWAATSPDAVGLRVIPNPDYLSPLRWYNENIKLKGSPQALIVDGYEAVRDGRTVYVNAANIYLPNDPVNNKFFTNIYIISYNQQAENPTVDIFGQLLSHWRFNKEALTVGKCVQPDKFLSGDCLVDGECKTGEYCDSQKAKIIRDTRRLSDLAEIKFILEKFKAQSGVYPQLVSGSYLAKASISVWPSWKNTLASDLKSPLPIDPLNRLGLCGGAGYDKTTCWDPASKEFAGADKNGDGQFDFPSCSFAYVYIAKNKVAYTLCALMESGYISTLNPDACPGSAEASTGREATCADLVWKPDDWSNVCPGDKIVQTSNCGNTRTRSDGTKAETNPNCAASTCPGSTCDTGCEIVPGAKVETIWTSSIPLDQVCSNQTVTQTGDCGGTRQTAGTKCCGICSAANQPNCRASDPGNAVVSTSGCCPTGQACYRCPDNYTWNGSGCVADTRNNVNCTTKPPNTIWNTSGTVSQTWNGSLWQPSNISSYNDDLAGGPCYYKCAPNYRYSNGACNTFCGNGVREAVNGEGVSEQCDGIDGVGVNQSCSATCTLINLTYCGDGTTQSPNDDGINETCDDGRAGNTNTCVASYGTTRTCCSTSCQSNTVTGPSCGDGIVTAGREECDPTDIDPITSEARTNSCTETVTPGLTWCPISFISQGTQPCRDDGSCTWDTGVCDTEIIETTSTGCQSTNVNLTNYTCCQLISCSQDGCGCCGVDVATTTPGYTEIVKSPSAWDNTKQIIFTWGTKNGKVCAGGYKDGNIYKPPPVPFGQTNIYGLCTSCQDKYSRCATQAECYSADNTCKLNQDLPYPSHIGNAKNWEIKTNHSTAYYKCWR